MTDPDIKKGLAGVFGYCAFNDLSARTFQRATPQWTFGKNAERSGPMSALVTADEVGQIGEVIKEGLEGHFERLKEKEAQEVCGTHVYLVYLMNV